MPSQTKLIRIPRPFTKGWVTDRPRWSLDQQEMADGQDVFWPRGVAVQRRPWSYVQATDPLGSSAVLGGVMAVQFLPQDEAVNYVVTDSIGRVGIADSGNNQVAFTGPTATTYLPRAFYNGELLLCPQDGVSPILRWGGLNDGMDFIVGPASGGVGATATGTSISHARNSKVLTGSGTEFTTQAPANAYVGLNNIGNFGPTLRVVKVESDTSLSVQTTPFMLSTASSPVSIAMSRIDYSPYGMIGLRAAVTQMGTGTISSTTLTGQATAWKQSGQGYGALAAGDVIARLSQPSVGGAAAINSTPDAGIISAVASDNSATLLYAPGVTYTASPYVALRSMPGRDVCQHQGRLWITGVEWEPNRVYVTPPTTAGYELGQETNGEDSFEIDYANAAQAKYIDVPDRFSEGRVVTMLSGRNVLLVLRSNNCYGVFGAWPGITVEQIADGAGCVDLRAAVVADDAMYWCGEEGIYRYVPGSGIVDISLGRVSREWRRIMRDRSSSAIVSMGVVNRHIVISYLDGSTYGLGAGDQDSVTWLYDTVTQTWCGKVSDVRSRYMNTARLRGAPDDLYFIEGDPAKRKIGALASSFTDDDSATISGENIPTFYAETGSIVTGQATDSFRVTELRVGYECEGTLDPTLVVKTGASDASPTVTQATLPATTDISTAKLKASTSSSTGAGIGKQTRQFTTRIEQGSEKPLVARIHELQVVAREFSPRD